MSFDPNSAVPEDSSFDPSTAAPFSGPSTRQVLKVATQTNPDDAAEVARLAKRYPAPNEVLLRNLRDVKLQEAVDNADRKLGGSPKLAEMLRKSPFVAQQAHDDIDPLMSLETFFSDLGGSTKAGVFRASRGAAGTFQAGLEFIAPVLDPLEGVTAIGGNPLRRLAEGFAMQGAAAGETAKAARPKTEGVLAGGFFSGVESLTQNLLSLPLAFAPGGQGAALGMMTAGTGGDAYQTAREKGLPMSQALPYAASQAAIEYATEKLPLARLLGDVKAGTPFAQTLAKQIALEVPGEQVATVLQDLNDWAVLNPEKPFSAYLEERPSAAAQTLVATIVGTGGNVAVVKGIESMVNRGLRDAKEIENAERAGQGLEQALKIAAASKLRERNPETFQQLVQQMAEQTEGAPQTVFIDAQVLMQSATPEQIAQLLPSTAEQLEAAVASNGMLEVPISEALTALPGTPLEQVFLQNARANANALSLADAQQASEQAGEFLKAEADRVLSEAQDRDAWEAEADAVKAAVLADLNTAARFSPEANEAYAVLQANFFSTMAARVGLTPQALFDRYRLKVTAQGQGGQVLNADSKPGEIAVEGYHYSKAARPVISTRFYGTGLRGSGRETYVNAADTRLRNRAYFYVDKGTGINPESGVGGVAQRANLTNIYDSDTDPLGLKKGANQLAFESAVLDAGFSGYLARMDGTQSGQVILLGDQAVQAEVLGPMGRIEAGQRVEALPRQAPQWKTQASGDPAQLQARLERMQSNPAWANYDMRIEGRELQVREKGDGVFNQSLSSRLPSAVKATEDPLADVLNITYDVVLSDTKTLAKNVAALQALPNMRKLKGKGAKDPVRNAEAFIDHVTNNLLWLHDHMPAEMRDRARLWYDGGRKTVEEWAKRYGISEMQGAAAIAVLSPQNGWFANVSQAERIADMVFGLRNFAWDDAMTAEAERISAEGALDDKMQAAVGKTLGELLATPDVAARWVRVYDQTYNNRAYRVLTPEGGAADYVKTGAGADATMMWKSYSTIAKAISVFTDGRAENVHYQIGKEHKVRNFYNNIFDPNSPLGYATIDTHAVAAGLLRPLAAADIEVAQAFGGGGSASSAVTGLNGTYPIYLEAYRRAAEARGLQPRQMQSITWEAIRGLFEAAAKRGMKAPANVIWERYKAGEIEQEQAQQEILALAGDITPPAWTEVPFNDQPGRTYEGAPQAAIDGRAPPTGVDSQVMFEVAPDPNDGALRGEWQALPYAERLRISQEVAPQIVSKVLRELGTGGDFRMQLGGYEGLTNPSMALHLERPELALTAAKLLGFALAQDSMMVVSETPFVGSEPVGAVTLTLPEGYGANEIKALYDRLWGLEQDGNKLVGGHTTVDGQMAILNYSGLTDEDLAGRIDAHLGGEFEIHVDQVYSAFPYSKDYGYGSDQQEGATAAQQSPAQRRPGDLRAEASQLLREALAGYRATQAGVYAQGGVNGGQPEQAGDRAGREAGAGPAPLPGAPVIEGATGPDPRLVAVAEQYARDNGIDLKRQAAYVEVDPERAARIAAEYDKMAHAPNDPAVREAYQNLIEQTVAQYRALEAAGYKFWFIDPENDPYKSPWDAMRELRASQTMGVFPTVAGFGSGATDVDTTGNPLEADTGILWPYGSPNGELKPVLANDLFRAVHDAFGHGLEGSGFRAQGEENAWQAHIRLFTGSAKGAITSETRGQNSWLNYGPHGETNRTAKVEDTIFADQKTGLMPEWTWAEGVAGDFQDTLEQGPRGTFNPQTLLITLNESANLSTFLHESGHFFLEVMADLASQPNAPAQIQDDMAQVLAWFGVPDLATWNSYTLDQKRPYHERFAESFEQYLLEGRAPSTELQPLFRKFRSWLLQVYKSLKAFIASRVPVTTGGSELGQGVAQTDTPEFKRWFGDSKVRERATSSRQKPNEMPPKVVYHATLNDFVGFETQRETVNSTTFGDITTSRSGIFFAEDPAFAEGYGKGEGQRVMPVYLSIKNPIYLDEGISGEDLTAIVNNSDGKVTRNDFYGINADEMWQAFDGDFGRAFVAAAKAAGYDGAFMIESDPDTGESRNVWVAFEPTQIKSATGNDGTFDADDPSILSQGAAPTGPAIQLNDEIRKVFDRMLATDEQIAEAEKVAGMLPDFDATNEAIEQLQTRSMRDMKWLAGARNKTIKALQKQAATLRKAVEDEVREEVDAMPEFRAQRALAELRKSTPEYRDALKKWTADRDAAKAAARGNLVTALLAENPDTKGLQKGQLLAKNKRTLDNQAEAAALEWEKTTPRPVKPVVSNDTEMAVIAEANGYASAEAMLAAIDAVGKKADVIEGLTDQRMLERHGDLVDQRAIEEAANAAVHNEARARMLATELKAQSEALNPRADTGRTNAKGSKITVNALHEAAKQFAADLTARRKLKDLKNATWQHTAAERRASKRWAEATAKGDTQGAVQAKRDQLLNNLTAKAMAEAQAEVKKIEEFFAKVTKGNDEKVVKGGRDPDVVNAMRAMLAAYDIAPRLEKAALEYMEAVRLNDPAMFNALAPGVQAATLVAKPFGELTIEELRGLHEELRAMWLLAKRSRQMEVDGNLLDLDDAADQLMARMTEIGVPDTIPGEKGAITDAQERGIKLRFFKAILSRAEQWAERLDGRFGGPFLRLVFQPIKEAADRYRTARIDYRQRFTALLENLAPAMPRGPINAPELGYTFGSARDSGVAELLHAILHTGNDSNKRKLLLGRGWATEMPDGTLDTSRWDDFINRMYNEGRIGKEHYDFAQGVWDLLEEMKPLAQEAHRKVYGRYFAEVTANEVATPFGNYRGGYVPAQTDARIVKDAKLRELAEGENESMAYAFPSSPNGFTKARVDYNKPLLLDLRALAQHMDKVLLFSHMQPAVNDVRRLLTAKRVSYALDRIDPSAYEGMLIPWLNRAAKQIVETPVVGDRRLSRFLSAARSRAGMALMFANLSNTVQQITGFSMAAVKVKPSLMLKATAEFTRSPKALKQTVADASAYMKDRMLNENAAMIEATEQILTDPTLLERGQAWTQRHAYFMQAAVDNTMSPIIWTAAYNQAIEEGSDERDAVRFADGVVRQTQGSTLPEDISRFESGPGYARLFTQFVSYFNMMANTNATAVKQITDEMGLRKGAGKLVYVALAGLLAPIWVAELIANAFRGGPEDDEDDGYLDDWLMAVFGIGTVRGLVAQVPIVGQMVQLAVNRFNDNPADDKFSLSPAVSLIESSVSAPRTVYDAIVEDGNKAKALRDTAAAATMITGLPIYGALRPAFYLTGIADDRVEPTGPVDFARGLVTGTASPESKQ